MAETFRLIKRRDAENEPNAPRLIKSRGGNRAVVAEPEQTPEETRSLLSQAGGVGLSGLHTVGSLLSTVSRGTHGTINALTGGEGGFGNLNPIDSTGGIEGSRHLERLGILAKNDPTKWEWRDPLAGVADIAMDPLTYAAGVGLVKRGIQGIGALTGLTPVVKSGVAIAAKSAPVTKLKQLFHASSMGRTTHGTQKMAERTYDDIGDNLINADLGVNNTVRNMELRAGGPIAKDAERHAIEMGNPSREISPLKAMDDAAHAEKQALGIPTGDLENTIKQFTKVGAPRALRTDVLDDGGNVVRSIDNTVGGPIRSDASPVNYLRPNQRTEYAPRHIGEGAEWGGVAGSGSRLAMSTKNSLDQHRNTELFGNASTDLINRVFARAGEHLNTLPTGLSANQQARELSRFIKREFRGEDLASGTNLTGNYAGNVVIGKVNKVTGEPLRRAHSRPRELGQFIANNPQLTKAGPFTNHPVHDYNTSLKAAAQQIPKARNALKFMAENAAINHGEPLDVLRRNRLDNAPTVRDAAKALDLATDKVGKHILGQLPPGVLSQVNTAAGDEAARLAAHAVSQGDPRPVADIAKEMFPRIRDRQVLDLQLPSGEFQSLTGFMEPPPQDATGGFLSWLNTTWKANMLAHPATQIRNAGSAAVQAGLKEHAGLGDLYSGAQLVRGQQVSGLAKHPDVASLMASQGIDETEAMRRLAGAYFPVNNSIAAEMPIGQVGSELSDLAGNIPGRFPVAAHEAITGPMGALAGYRDGGHVGWNAINPTAIGGVLGHKQTGFGPAMAATMAARNIEQPIRMGSMMGLMRQGHSARDAARQVGEAQVNYGPREFSEFEKKIKQVVPFYCVPVDHEIMTRAGWKFCHDLEDGEEVMGYDLPTGSLMWTPLEAVNTFRFDGELLAYRQRKNGRAKNRDYCTVEFLFTDDHRWPTVTDARIQPMIGKKYESQPEMRLQGGLRRFKTGATLSRSDRIPCAGRFVSFAEDDKSWLSPRLAAILGWVVTDSYHRWKGNYCEMVVYQSPCKHLDAIIALLGTRPRPPHPESGVVSVPVSLEDSTAIRKLFHSKKDLSEIVTHLSQAAAESMWLAMMDAESSTTGPLRSVLHFAQSATTGVDVRNAFQILSFLLGKCANLSRNGAYVKKSKTYHVQKLVEKQEYHGMVWCPTTSCGTWVMRHNGALVITGNSFNTRMGKQVLSELANNPGGRLGMLLKAEDKMQGSDPGIPDSVSSGTSIPFSWGQPDDGTQRYLTGLGLSHEPAINTLGALAGGNFRGAGYDLLGMLNPLLKTPLEHVTGQSFYQRGEPQDHLDPNVGRIMSNLGVMTGLRDKDAGPVQYPGSAALETALAVSPFSRVVTTAKQLTDTRKGVGAKALNTLTGARLTDVSPDKQRFTIQKRAKKMAIAAGARSHEDVYFSKAELDRLKISDPVLFEKQKQLQAILSKLNRKQDAKVKASN